MCHRYRYMVSHSTPSFTLTSREMCNRQRREELHNMRQIQEKFPHRHISNLKKKGEDWEPPKKDDA